MGGRGEFPNATTNRGHSPVGKFDSLPETLNAASLVYH